MKEGDKVIHRDSDQDKDKDKRNQASKDSMKRKREGLATGINNGGVNTTSSPESSTKSVTSGTWETIPIKQIKEILPDSLVNQIERLSEWSILHNRPATFEDRLRMAYKYHVWHEENFIHGVHKDLA